MALIALLAPTALAMPDPAACLAEASACVELAQAWQAAGDADRAAAVYQWACDQGDVPACRAGGRAREVCLSGQVDDCFSVADEEDFRAGFVLKRACEDGREDACAWLDESGWRGAPVEATYLHEAVEHVGWTPGNGLLRVDGAEASVVDPRTGEPIGEPLDWSEALTLGSARRVYLDPKGFLAVVLSEDRTWLPTLGGSVIDFGRWVRGFSPSGDRVFVSHGRAQDLYALSLPDGKPVGHPHLGVGADSVVFGGGRALIRGEARTFVTDTGLNHADALFEYAQHAELSPDGERIADRGKLWDLQSPLPTVIAPIGPSDEEARWDAKALAFDPVDRFLAIAVSDGVHLVDGHTAEQVAGVGLAGVEGEPRFSADGTWLSQGSEVVIALEGAAFDRSAAVAWLEQVRGAALPPTDQREERQTSSSSPFGPVTVRGQLVDEGQAPHIYAEVGIARSETTRTDPSGSFTLSVERGTGTRTLMVNGQRVRIEIPEGGDLGPLMVQDP